MDKSEQKIHELTLRMRELERRFPSDRQASMCDVFPTKMAVRRVEMRWEQTVHRVKVSAAGAAISALFGNVGGLGYTGERRHFKTFHCVSNAGYSSLYWRGMAGDLILLTAGFVGLFVFLCFVLGGITVLLSLNKPDDLREALVALAGGVIGVFLIIVLNSWSKKVRFPETFQALLPRGAHLRKLKKVRGKKAVR